MARTIAVLEWVFGAWAAGGEPPFLLGALGEPIPFLTAPPRGEERAS